MADANAIAEHVRKVFGRYADAPIWVAWESRPHTDPGKPPIKIPINPGTGYPASSTDARTWAPMGRAIALASRNNLAGIGIMLGPDPDQNPDARPDKPYLVGVDYDNALRSDGTLMPWAQDLFLTGTYAEISPSGTGVKAFAVSACRPAGLPTDGRDGMTLKLGSIEAAGDGKRPGIEVYAGKRWFAVTGRTFGGSDVCKIADMTSRLPILLRRAAPQDTAATPLPIPTDPEHAFTPQDARDAHASALPDEARALLTQALQSHPDLAKAMVGTDWPDRSLALFTAADLAKGYKLTFDQYVHGVMAATGAAGEHVRSQADPYRALSRAWDRSPNPEPVTNVQPVPPGAMPGDRPGVTGDGYTGVQVDLSIFDEVNPLGTPYTLPLDLYANPPPLPKFILDGIFPAAPSAMVGTGGVLKSTIWMAMALNMLLARPQWGRLWWEGGAALMISKEDERSIMLRRLHDLLHGMGVTQRQYQDIVARRFYLDDMTEAGARLVEADGRGNLCITPTVENLVDKYAGRNVSLSAIDPMVNFGPGETHGNDGAALMMQIAWRFVRGWGGEEGRCNLCYIHHISKADARDEVEDQHAGRGAAAVGDNARALWVMHRHKVLNANRHVAPSSIPADAIEKGDVIRMVMAKNSYARRIMEPFWAWREGDAVHFVEPMAAQEARMAAASVLTPAEQARADREQAKQSSFLSWVSSQVQGFTLSDAVRTFGLTYPATRRMIENHVASGDVQRVPGLAERYTAATRPTTDASYGF